MTTISMPADVFGRITVPNAVCARTGRPATKTVKGVAQQSMDGRDAAKLALLVALFFVGWLLLLLFGSPEVKVPYELPAAKATLRRRALAQWSMVLVGFPGAFIAFWAFFEPGVLSIGSALLAVAAFVACCRAYVDSWVGIRLSRGRLTFTRLSPEFAAALQAEVDRVANAVPAGWYADPSGTHALRWWDGGEWTVHVSGAAS